MTNDIDSLNREDLIIEDLTPDLEKNTLNSLISVDTKEEEQKLTEKQRALNEKLINICANPNNNLEQYIFGDYAVYDLLNAGTLENFLDDNKDNKDLKIILNLKRGESESTVLHDVAKLNVKAVELLLKAGADPNIRDKEGKIPLHCAANANCLQAVECLVKADKTGINTQDIYGITPLYYAAEESYEDVVIELLDKGANIDIQNKEGNTPLHNAARRGDLNIVELLTEKNPDINLKNKNGDTALHLALNSKDTRVPESILGRTVKGNIDFNIRDNKGDTTLLLAASLAQANVLREILKQGADVKCVNSEGNTALHYATYNSYTGENCKTTKSDTLTSDNDPLDSNSNNYSEDTPYKCVDELIYAGIDVNTKNNYDQTPLFFATEANNINVTEQLLEKGADIKVQDKNGYTAFHYAIKIQNLKMLKALLPCKIDEYGVETEEVDTEKAKEILANIRDNEGNTLLHHATKYGCSSGMLNFFVESGVDINAKNRNGVAPIHIAAKYGHANLIDFFIENEADINLQCGNFTKSEIDITEKNFINVQDGSGDASSVIDVKNDTNYKDVSPISIAADNGHISATGKFLLQGVKPNIKDYRGWTPIQIAIRTACNENCTEEEREKAYSIIEKLALFSDEVYLTKEAEANERIVKDVSNVIEELEMLADGLCLTEEFEANERIGTILEKALSSRESDKTPSAPVDEHEPSDYDDFYDKIGSYVKDIPELCLYSDLSKKLEENTINSMVEEQSIEEKPDKKSTKQKIDSMNKIRLTFYDREKLNTFSDKVAKSKDIGELNQVVSAALKLGVRLNSLNNKNNNFTDVVMQKVQELKENSKISSNIICNLVSKGADINKKSYEKVNQALEEVFKDHKTNIQKAYLEANKRINDFHEAVANATTGKIEFIEIDNTTFYLEYSADSIVDVAKAIEAARGLGLYDGNITFGSNIVKIGKDEVEIETSNGIRNYTDLSDNGAVIVTFQTSLGELDVRLYNSTQYEDFIKVEVCNPTRFNQLVDIKEEIGKNSLLGGLSVYDAIEQGNFKRSGKFQPSETVSCKGSEPSEVVSFSSQDFKGDVEKIMEGISNADIKNAEEESLVNIIEGKRTNESCIRGV